MTERSVGRTGTGANVLVLAAADRTETQGCTAGHVGESDGNTVAVVYGRRYTGSDARDADGRIADERGGSFRGYVTVDPPLDIGDSATRTEVARTAAGNGGTGSAVETVVSSPRDLVGLWVTISLYVEELAARGERTTLCFDSLTALLESVTSERAYRFVRLLLGRLRRANAASHFHLDPDGIDSGTVANFRSLFDDTLPDSAESTHPPRRRASVIAALGSPERRCVLDHLLETEGRATIQELAARLVAENGVDGGIETVRLALYHDHLPELAETGLVSFDSRTERVELAASGAELEWLTGDVGDPGGTRSTTGDRR